MTLEELSAERPKANIKLSAFVLATWLVWLCFVSTLSLPGRLSISCTALVLIFGCFYWSVLQGLFIFLLMGVLYHGFSITPPGLFWMALTILFVLLKAIMFRLSIRNISQLLSGIFFTALFFEIVQWLLLRMAVDIPVGSWAAFGGILLSALLQTVIGIVFVKPLLNLVAHK